MEWKKLACMEYEKIVFHSIPYHALVTRRMEKIKIELLNADQLRRNNNDCAHIVALMLEQSRQCV